MTCHLTAFVPGMHRRYQLCAKPARSARRTIHRAKLIWCLSNWRRFAPQVPSNRKVRQSFRDHTQSFSGHLERLPYNRTHAVQYRYFLLWEATTRSHRQTIPTRTFQYSFQQVYVFFTSQFQKARYVPSIYSCQVFLALTRTYPNCPVKALPEGSPRKDQSGTLGPNRTKNDFLPISVWERFLRHNSKLSGSGSTAKTLPSGKQLRK